MIKHGSTSRNSPKQDINISDAKKAVTHGQKVLIKFLIRAAFTVDPVVEYSENFSRIPSGSFRKYNTLK